MTITDADADSSRAMPSWRHARGIIKTWRRVFEIATWRRGVADVMAINRGLKSFSI